MWVNDGPQREESFREMQDCDCPLTQVMNASRRSLIIFIESVKIVHCSNLSRAFSDRGSLQVQRKQVSKISKKSQLIKKKESFNSLHKSQKSQKA